MKYNRNRKCLLMVVCSISASDRLHHFCSYPVRVVHGTCPPNFPRHPHPNPNPNPASGDTSQPQTEAFEGSSYITTLGISRTSGRFLISFNYYKEYFFHDGLGGNMSQNKP